jgi:hypothetical protein
LGNIGLAIGMLILGGAFITYGLLKWKKEAGKQLVFLLIVFPALVVGTVLANVNFKSSEQIMEDVYEQHDTQIEEVRHSDKPNFKNTEVEKYLAEFDVIYKRFEQNLQSEDKQAIIASETEFMEWSSNASALFPQLSSDETQELARYMAKLSVSWNDLRTK